MHVTMLIDLVFDFTRVVGAGCEMSALPHFMLDFPMAEALIIVDRLHEVVCFVLVLMFHLGESSLRSFKVINGMVIRAKSLSMTNAVEWLLHVVA